MNVTLTENRNGNKMLSITVTSSEVTREGQFTVTLSDGAEKAVKLAAGKLPSGWNRFQPVIRVDNGPMLTVDPKQFARISGYFGLTE